MNLKDLSKQKKELDRLRPFPKELVRNLDDWFRVELTYTSNAIEGNTLTRQETALVVEKGLTVGGKSLREHLEASNHAQALNWIKQRVSSGSKNILEQDILLIHETILKGIDEDNAGRYRKVPVRISGSNVILPNYLKVPELVKNMLTWLKKQSDLHPVEIAAEAHYQLVSIHPFVDGNGRTARLLMNMILMLHGYPPAIINNKDRLKYIKSLEKAQLGGTKDDYYQLIDKALARSLEIYLKALKNQEPRMEKEEKLLKIGELAKLTAQSVSTIRHWTREGLLEVAEVTGAGYQLYGREMVERVGKIVELKEKKRMSLGEIRGELHLL